MKLRNLTGMQALSIAVNQEYEGIRFYKNAADAFDDEEIKNVFLQLVKEEEKHANQFTAFKDRIESEESDVELFEEPTALAEYVDTLCDSHIFSEDLEDDIKEKTFSSVKEALRIALNLEKTTVLFYLAVEQTTNHPGGKKVFSMIAEEEMKHVIMLRNLIERERSKNGSR